jgi:hypothetical protein
LEDLDTEVYKLKIIRLKEWSQIAVVTGSKWNKWRQSEKCKTWSQ